MEAYATLLNYSVLLNEFLFTYCLFTEVLSYVFHCLPVHLDTFHYFKRIHRTCVENTATPPQLYCN